MSCPMWSFYAKGMEDRTAYRAVVPSLHDDCDVATLSWLKVAAVPSPMLHARMLHVGVQCIAGLQELSCLGPECCCCCCHTGLWRQEVQHAGRDLAACHADMHNCILSHTATLDPDRPPPPAGRSILHSPWLHVHESHRETCLYIMQRAARCECQQNMRDVNHG